MILSNNTLTELVRRRPDSPESLAEVKGIGKAKLQQYGEELLKLLQDPEADRRSALPVTASESDTKGPNRAGADALAELDVHRTREEVTEVRSTGFSRNLGEEPPKGGTTNTALVAMGSHPSPPVLGDAVVQPSHYWTWRLLSSGFTAEESAAIRGIRREVLLDHALRAVEEGRPFRAEWWCPSPRTSGGSGKSRRQRAVPAD